MRRPLFAFPCAFSLFCLATVGCLPAAAADALPCQGRPTSAETGVMVCPLPATASPQVLRFTARFGGVHDDSSAAVDVLLDDVALPCAAGSRPSLAGEDSGDTLLCKLLPAASTAARSLRFQLRWHHAEPAAFELRAD